MKKRNVTAVFCFSQLSTSAWMDFHVVIKLWETSTTPNSLFYTAGVEQRNEMPLPLAQLLQVSITVYLTFRKLKSSYRCTKENIAIHQTIQSWKSVNNITG